MTNWELIINIIGVFYIIGIIFIIYILSKHHVKEFKESENTMGFTKNEEEQSEYLALKDNLELLKKEIEKGHNKQALKRIDYILSEQV